jgi:hypothetical protein
MAGPRELSSTGLVQEIYIPQFTPVMKITTLKWLALLQIALALVESGLGLRGHNPEGGSDMLAAALALFFFARETVNDERVDSLKLKAIRIGLVSGLCVLLIWNGVMAREYALPRISAFDAVSVIMLAAIGLFTYWRWQDGQAEKAG